jgi:hypothetical protein
MLRCGRIVHDNASTVDVVLAGWYTMIHLRKSCSEGIRFTRGRVLRGWIIFRGRVTDPSVAVPRSRCSFACTAVRSRDTC